MYVLKGVWELKALSKHGVFPNRDVVLVSVKTRIVILLGSLLLCTVLQTADLSFLGQFDFGKGPQQEHCGQNISANDEEELRIDSAGSCEVDHLVGPVGMQWE